MPFVLKPETNTAHVATSTDLEKETVWHPLNFFPPILLCFLPPLLRTPPRPASPRAPRLIHPPIHRLSQDCACYPGSPPHAREPAATTSMPLTGWNPLAPVLQTVAAFSRHILIAPDAGLDDHRLRPLLALSLSPPSPAPPQPEVRKASRFSPSSAPNPMSSSVWFDGGR
jgi:hypothetical protein